MTDELPQPSSLQKQFREASSKVFSGMLYGAGLLLPSALIALYGLYFRYLGTAEERVSILSIAGLSLFCLLGYLVFRRALFPRFGRITLFMFVSWTLFVLGNRVALFLEAIDSETVRLYNTIAALFFSIVLAYLIWGWQLLGRIYSYFFTLNGGSNGH